MRLRGASVERSKSSYLERDAVWLVEQMRMRVLSLAFSLIPCLLMPVGLTVPSLPSIRLFFGSAVVVGIIVVGVANSVTQIRSSSCACRRRRSYSTLPPPSTSSSFRQSSGFSTLTLLKTRSCVGEAGGELPCWRFVGGKAAVTQSL